jgi:hypothetical protein
MELIMAILVSLGFITKKSESYDLNKIKTTETYQKVYNKTGVDLNANPQAWADVLNIK